MAVKAKTRNTNRPLTKSALIEQISKKTKLSKRETEKTLNSFLDTVKQMLKQGQKVQLIPFGSFEVRHRAARTGRNPRTGAKITIRARKVPAFRPGKALKQAVR
ncbi:MAG: HU family DNA-binding protein [Candidatus Eremiobacteraeota bacterium]|nr:HU family DNA-binding protein [Candidatus Eremiobacteraeota bacterium]MCL5054573.1 HU family DNA-binding protein [Bacillota bacterium]